MEDANCSIWLDIRINRGTILTKIKYSLFSMLFIRNAIIKKGKEKLPSSLFESVCGMLNRNGGHIFLGVDDDGKVIGTYKSYIASMKKDFANLCNTIF